MKRYALMAAGAASRSLLARLPGLSRELGPVASSSIRIAARIVNALHGGQAVADVSTFDDFQFILVCAPDTGLDRVVKLLSDAPLNWPRKTILFLDSNTSSLEYPLFQNRGAAVGSLNPIDGVVKSFMVEGSPDALREARRLAKTLGGKCFEVEPGQIRFFQAARTISTSLLTPLIDTCVECLQTAGVDRATAGRLAEVLFARTLRSYMHAGRRGWSGAVADNDRAAIEREYEAMKTVNPLRAEYFRQSAEFAFDLYETFPELSRYLPKP